MAKMWMRTLIMMAACDYEEDEGEAMMAIARTRQGRRGDDDNDAPASERKGGGWHGQGG